MPVVRHEAPRQLRSISVVTLTMLLWPLLESLPSHMTERYSPFEIVWIRYATHLLLMLALWAPDGPARLVRTSRPALHAVRALTMLGMPASFVLASGHMSTDETMSIFWVAPMVALILASLTLRESPGWRSWTTSVTGYAGTLLILGAPGSLQGVTVLPLAMATCFALYLVLTRLMRDETMASRLFYTALGVWIPLSFSLPWWWQTPTLHDLALMMAIGGIGFLILLGLDYALDACPVSTLAPFLVVQPVWAVLVATLQKEQVPEPRDLVGIAVVLLAWLPLLRSLPPGRQADGSIA